MLDFDKLQEDCARREYLGRMMNSLEKSCPECGTRQIQLVAYIDTLPAKWKCRHCKHEFEWEPEVV